MSSKSIIYLSLILVLSQMGCKKNFLDRQPLDRISSSAVFADKALTEAYLFNLYSTLPVGYSLYGGSGRANGDFGETGIYMLANVSDEARSRSDYVSAETIVVPGKISATQNPLGTWGKYYSAIRIANNIIGNLKNSPFEKSYIDRVTAEARVIRAMFYFHLARSYGGVPLITTAQEFEDKAGLLVAKTPQQEVYNFISKELEEVSLLLPSAANLPTAEYGRVTREAAWALNGRVLLYAKDYAKSAAFSKKVMDGNLFSLEPNYNTLFQSYGKNREVIFEILFNGVERGHSFDMFNVPRPFGLGYMSDMNPTQDMVDAYEMTNGLPITDPASGYDPQDPYKGRDPRLQATIYYHGSVFRGTTLNMVYKEGTQAQDIDYASTITGYYIRKFIDESGIVPDDKRSKTSWKELRLGEVLLNYAEAQNEASGPDQSVYDAVNKVRARAQMPGLPLGLSKENMRLRIMQERRVELAFEDFRWYDLIRWNLSKTVLNDRYYRGVKITRDVNNKLVYTYYPINFRSKQIFLDRNYLLPIPQDELNKNPNLTQNPGY